MKAILHPRLGYVSEVPTNVTRFRVLQAFHPPPHGLAEQEKLHIIHLVRALEVYVQITSTCRRIDQLQISFAGQPFLGDPKLICNWSEH